MANDNFYLRKSRITDVINYPVFGDYGRLIFPVDEGYWSGNTLEDLRLVWYNYIGMNIIAVVGEGISADYPEFLRTCR